MSDRIFERAPRHVEEVVIRRRGVQEINNGMDVGARGRRTCELLGSQTNDLIRTVATTDMAIGTSDVEELLGADQLLLSQGRHLALTIDSDLYVINLS